MKRQILASFFSAIFSLLSVGVYAQDSTKIFSLEDLYKSMIEFHPIVKQAKLLPEQAKQELRIARGSGFDPKFTSLYDNKTFGGKEYFSIWQNALKVPTWFGAEFKAGYDEMYGQFLNPQNSIPSNGLSYIGLSVPLGQGLIIDQRRGQLRQAQIFQKLNDAEKVKIINKIFFEAAKDYWEWFFRYNREQNLLQGFNLANERYAFVKKRVDLGEEAAIDSVEAHILLQNRMVSYSQAEIEVQNSLLQLSNHIWGENDTPLELSEKTKPETFNFSLKKITTESLNDLLDFAKISHPELLKLDLKIKSLDIERKLSIENIKPTINLNYSILSGGKPYNFELGKDVFTNNSKYGFDISLPLFYRKEIGKLQLTKSKIKQTQFEKNFTARTIKNEINKFYNELTNTEKLIEIQKVLVRNYVLLRNGELEKFNNGESTLFLVNNRETNLIDTQIKLAELESKYEKAKAGMYWAAGKTEFE
jgi:outer membrane protein TolC